jgi:general secretion pathway protein A
MRRRQCQLDDGAMPLRHTLVDHAVKSYHILTTMAAELLTAAAQRDLPVLDEKLYMEIFAQPSVPRQRRVTTAR